MSGRVPRRPLKGILLLVLLALVVASVVYATTAPGSPPARTETPPQRTGDVFVGDILNGPVRGTVEGQVMADLDCRGSMSATTCRAIVNSDDGRRIEFLYTHDMSKQPCLSRGDRVMIEAREDGGQALLTRLGR